MSAFDVVVLGGGSAGLYVATEAAGGGKSVALVEAGLIGGESAYLACLPSNSLLLSAARGQTWEDAVVRRNEVTGGLDDSVPARRLADAGVTVIRGTGRIAGPGTVEVGLAPGQDQGGQDQGGWASWKISVATTAARTPITIEPAAELLPKMRETSQAMPPMTPAAGMVNTHAAAIWPTTPQWTLASFLPRPDPSTPPETTWVVESG